MSPLSPSTIDVRRVAHPAGGVFADFVVDGLALSTRARRKADMVGCLGWGDAATQDLAASRLLLESPPDTPTGRVSLYICKECGDLSCGAMSVRVRREGNIVTWSDFYYEADYEPFAANNRLLDDLGPYRFSWRLYEAAIRAGRNVGVTHSGIVHWLAAADGGRTQRPVTLRWVGVCRFPQDGAEWPDGSWSMVLSFDYPPAEQTGPSRAKLCFLFEGAPQERLQPGVRFSIHDGIKRIGDVEILD